VYGACYPKSVDDIIKRYRAAVEPGSIYSSGEEQAAPASPAKLLRLYKELMEKEGK
jgi:hypothetical protein